MELKFPSAVPEIPVRDINEAAAYYENNLGFTVDWGGEELGLAGVSKGDCRMFLANSDYRRRWCLINSSAKRIRTTFESNLLTLFSSQLLFGGSNGENEIL